jgi:translocation and assembly module TamB
VTNKQPESNFYRRLWLLLSSRTSIVFGTILLLVLTGGVLYARNLINQRLVPLVEKNLKQLLGRPVEIGEVEGFSLNGLRFDSASIPATKEDIDRITAEAVKVEFNLWRLLFNQTLGLNVTLINPDIYLDQTPDGRWISTEFQTTEGGSDVIEIDLETIRARNADLVLNPTFEPGRPQGQVAISQVDAVTRFLESDRGIEFEVSGQPTRGGKFDINGQYLPTSQQTELAVEGQNLLAADVSRLLDLPITLQAGRTDADLTVQLQPEQEQPVVVGQASFSNVTAQIPNIPQKFFNTQGKLLFQEGRNIALENLTTSYGTIPIQLAGSLNTLKGYNLSGQVDAVSAKNLFDTLDLDLPFPTTGTLQAELQLQGEIEQPILTGNVSTINTAQIDRVGFSNINTRFRLTPQQLTFNNIRGTPVAGGLITGRGRIDLEQNELVVNLQGQNVSGNAIARGYEISPDFTIGNVSGTARIAGTPDNIRTVAQLRTSNATYPGRARVVVTNEGRTLIRNAVFQVAGGTVRGRGQYDRGQFQGVVNTSNVALNPFNQELRGQLNANLRFSGTAFDLSNIQAQGQVGFDQGLALIEQPLTAQVRWNGEQIIVREATAPGFNASGTVGVRLEEQIPEIAAFNLNVRADDYDLQYLGLDFPGNIALTGAGDFTGRVTGSPKAPNAIGDIRLQDLTVNNLAFEPVLTGRLNARSGQRTQLQVSGQQDQIAFVLDRNNQPSSFFIRRNDALARGVTKGENLVVNVEDFPIAVLRNAIPGDALQNLEPIAGNISANLVIDLAQNIAKSSVVGEFAIAKRGRSPIAEGVAEPIAQPRLGSITAEEFRGRIRYQDGNFTLREGQLLQDESRIALSGDLQAGREFQFQINLDSARIERVLQTLNAFIAQNSDNETQPIRLAGEKIFQDISVGLPNAPLLAQLRRFLEIKALVRQQRRENNEATIPTLAELNGTLNGNVIVSGSLQPGRQQAFNVNFDLLGNDWVWGEYNIEEAIAKGTFDNGVLTLQPLRIDLGEAFLAYRGQLGQQELSGQLEVESLPVTLVKPFLPTALPVNVAGELDALVNLAGSLNNPTAQGEVALVGGRVNKQPLETAQLDFTYNDARLNFDSNVAVAQTQQPVEITGSIPVQLPLASVEPDSNQINLQANLQNENLALLNLFTDAVTWVDGQGQVNLDVGGTLNQPNIMGTASVDNATFRTQALPQPLTSVTGNLELNGDRLVIEQIQANYNRDSITAQGVLPIFNTQLAQQLAANNPLTVSFNDLSINLKGLYQGDVSGNVAITDTVFSPDLGGKIRLSNGEVLIRGREQTPATETDPDVLQVPVETAVSESPITFTGLELILAENVRVINQPLLNFEVMGDLAINGTLDNPRPVGVVSLTGGQINLFTTQFTLDRGSEQTVRFTPQGGLDPILDINLVATVPAVTGGRSSTPAARPFISNEVQEFSTTDFGSVSSVRVEATVQGAASKLEENLELTSDPARSEAEIVALLGGSFVNALNVGQADPALGLAAIGGAALFNNLQGNFSELFSALGISEFRLFPTIVTDSDDNTSVLGLAAEAVFNLVNDFSVSVSYVIGTDDPLSYNLIYRINNQWRVRGSSNFAGENRAVVEYEMSF